MGRKTSVFLSDELIERWHASGLSLSALVRLGLEAPERDIEARVGRAALEAAFGPGHTADVRHTANGVDTAGEVDTVPDTAPVEVSVAPREARAPEPKREKCPHPKARVLKGRCGVCGAHVGRSL